MTTTTSPSRPPRAMSAMKTFFVSGLGTTLEFYDFSIFGLAAALVFPAVFFPDLDPLVGTLVAFTTFGTGFIARPLGGVVLGHFGDRVGRRPVLVLTLVLMGISTFLIGCLPTHAAIGGWAALLIVVLRLVQGFAAGGEWGGAVLVGMEGAPAGRRGLWGSFTSMGIGLGTVLGIAAFTLASLLEQDAFLGWGWRVPFLIGGVLVIIGLVARLRLPAEENDGSERPTRLPVMEVLRERPRQLLCSIGVAYGYNAMAYLVSVFFLSYVVQVGYDETTSLVIQLVSATVLFLCAVLFGWLSDRVGRRPVIATGALASIVFILLFFPLAGTGQLAIVMALFVANGIMAGATQGPLPALLGEQFPQRMRFTGISLSYQVGAALGGGTAASVASGLLVLFDGNPTGVAVYCIFTCLVLAVCTLLLREGAHRSIDELEDAPAAREAQPA